MKFAFFSENKLVEIKELDSELKAAELAIRYQAVVDISANDPEPTIGWVLKENGDIESN